jgi:molybdate transport system substrate-binding protein
MVAPVAALLLACCSGADGTRLVVSAAASMTDAITEIAQGYEESSGIEISLNIAASSSLREQILSGAVVDVYVPADTSNMDQVVAAGLVDGYRILASNRLEIAVPKGNPANVTGLEDLANPTLFIGLCSPNVPCGSYGTEALASAGVVPSVDTYEADARALLTKVREGELDAGLVYATDVASDDLVDGVAVPEEQNVPVGYPIGRIVTSANPEAAMGFIDFAMSAVGQAILAKHGFSTS